MNFKASAIFGIICMVQQQVGKFFFDLKHPKRVIFTQGHPHHGRDLSRWEGPQHRKEDPKTKKRRKMAEASRKINRRK